MQRRRFLQTIGLAIGGWMLMPLQGFAASLQTVKGKVHSKGKPLAGVVVSDGYSVVKTDGKGRYEIKLHTDAVAVFVSVPAGYAIPNEKGIARFYHLLRDVQPAKNIDFELTALNTSDEEHQFVIWADTQIQNDKDVERLMSESVPDLQQLVKAAGTSALIHGITVGDIVWDDFNYFKHYETAVEKTGIPFFQCLGNHDMDLNKGDDSVSDDTFQETYGPTYYSFNRGRAHYVVLDDVRYLGQDKKYDGYIQQHQLDWLEKDLALVPADHLIIICAHIPVYNEVKNNDAFYKIVERFENVHVMTGHTHINVNVIKNNVFEHNHGTVCGAWWTGGICGDGTPSGYGVYTVKGNQLEWYYKSAGKPADYQLKLYTEKNLSGQQEVLANVWNYDPEWKVEYSVDNGNFALMQNHKGFDPLANELYLGPELPSVRRWVEPRNTDHLFKAVLPENARTVTVRAQDRFGKIYSVTQNI